MRKRVVERDDETKTWELSLTSGDTCSMLRSPNGWYRAIIYDSHGMGYDGDGRSATEAFNIAYTQTLDKT
jgi:hypothetical protein